MKRLFLAMLCVSCLHVRPKPGDRRTTLENLGNGMCRERIEEWYEGQRLKIWQTVSMRDIPCPSS